MSYTESPCMSKSSIECPKYSAALSEMYKSLPFWVNIMRKPESACKDEFRSRIRLMLCCFFAFNIIMLLLWWCDAILGKHGTCEIRSNNSRKDREKISFFLEKKNYSQTRQRNGKGNYKKNLNVLVLAVNQIITYLHLQPKKNVSRVP